MMIHWVYMTIRLKNSSHLQKLDIIYVIMYYTKSISYLMKILFTISPGLNDQDRVFGPQNSRNSKYLISHTKEEIGLDDS